LLEIGCQNIIPQEEKWYLYNYFCDNFLTTFSLIFTLFSYYLSSFFLVHYFWPIKKKEKRSCHIVVKISNLRWKHRKVQTLTNISFHFHSLLSFPIHFSSTLIFSSLLFSRVPISNPLTLPFSLLQSELCLRNGNAEFVWERINGHALYQCSFRFWRRWRTSTHYCFCSTLSC